MKQDRRQLTSGKPFVRPARLSLWGICLLMPVLMGGCPEFRNSSVDAVETAVRGIFDAALDLYFDQLRTDEVG